MNGYKNFCIIAKSLNYSFINILTKPGYSISRSGFNNLCHSSLVGSQTADGSRNGEKNVNSSMSGNTSSELALTESESKRSVIQPTEAQDLSFYGSVLKPSFNFAAYADKSPLLQKLIDLGVRLYEWEKKPETVEFILPLDFDRRIKPYLLFLSKHGVPTDEFGNFITKNPFIFKEDIDDLEVRINYLCSKKFDKEMIAHIITRNPKWLSIPVKQIDNRLGYLQQTFNLKGDEVRSIITREPGLVSIAMKKLYLNVLTLKEEMELEEHMVNKLVVAEPHLLRKDTHEYLTTYDYLRRVMKIPKNLILKTPKILNLRKHKINERHKFLMSLGRAQYNPLLPGYVSLSNFFELSDDEFCQKIAKTSLNTFYEFLKTF